MSYTLTLATNALACVIAADVNHPMEPTHHLDSPAVPALNDTTLAKLVWLLDAFTDLQARTKGTVVASVCHEKAKYVMASAGAFANTYFAPWQTLNWLDPQLYSTVCQVELDNLYQPLTTMIDREGTWIAALMKATCNGRQCAGSSVSLPATIAFYQAVSRAGCRAGSQTASAGPLDRDSIKGPCTQSPLRTKGKYTFRLSTLTHEASLSADTTLPVLYAWTS